MSFSWMREACRATWEAISLRERPTAENMGIFWPRAMEFMVWQCWRDVRHQAHGIRQRPLDQLCLHCDEPSRGTDTVFLGLP